MILNAHPVDPPRFGQRVQVARPRRTHHCGLCGHPLQISTATPADELYYCSRRCRQDAAEGSTIRQLALLILGRPGLQRQELCEIFVCGMSTMDDRLARLRQLNLRVEAQLATTCQLDPHRGPGGYTFRLPAPQVQRAWLGDILIYQYRGETSNDQP